MTELRVISGRVEYENNEYIVGDVFACNDVNRVAELIDKGYCEAVVKKVNNKPNKNNKPTDTVEGTENGIKI